MLVVALFAMSAMSAVPSHLPASPLTPSGGAAPSFSGAPTVAVANTVTDPSSLPGAQPTLASVLSLSATVYVGLAVQNASLLNVELAEISNPASPMYRHYLSHSEIETAFEPSVAVYEAIAQYYEGYGLQVLPSTDRLYLTLSGTLGEFSTAFATSFAQYTVPLSYSWGTVALPYYFNTQPIHVPSSLAPWIVSELGFSNYTGTQPMLRINPAYGAVSPAQAISIGAANNGTAIAVPQPPYTPGALQLAYNESALLNQYSGQYVTIAVTDAYGDPTAEADMVSFDTQYDVAAPPSFQVLQPDGSGTVATVTNGAGAVESTWEIETALDFEMAHVFAPSANLLSVVSPDAGYTLEQTLVYLITTQAANVISNSWGAPEPESGTAINYFHPFFEMAGLEGITVLAASGDQGSAGYDSAVPNSIMWPGDDPYVTVVGGTTLAMSGTVSTTQNPVNGPPSVPEVVNPTGVAARYAWDGYTGGGYSMVFPRPSWQTGEGLPTSGPFAGVRGAPDVAANAMFGGNDMVVNGVVNGGLAFGGTSFASPMWAGVLATADSYAASLRGNFLGFVNPSLYAVMNSPAYPLAFYDILNGTNGAYACGPGWSPVTGMGAPNVGFLASELAEYSFVAGAVGDARATNNTGVSAQIETVEPQTVYGQSANFAFVQDMLPDGTVLMTGYVTTAADPSGAPFYALIPGVGIAFDTSGVWTGANGGVGPSGSWNTFSILATAPYTWTFELNGAALASVSTAYSSTGRMNGFFGVNVLGEGTNQLSVGPVSLSGLSYHDALGWHALPAATAVVATTEFSTNAPPLPLPNPLGIAAPSNGTILVGSGEPNSNGQVLWGEPQALLPVTVLRTTPQYVTLYAQNTTSGSSPPYVLTTEFPFNQSNFNSFYIVPVLGLDTWDFHTSQPLSSDLDLSQGIPIVAHFFLSLATSVGTSSPGVVPVTVSASLSDGGAALGSGSVTQDLSVTGEPVEFNVSVNATRDAAPGGGYLDLAITWYEATAAGESLAWPLVIDSGAQYPISVDLPTLNPVDIAPPTVAATLDGITLSTHVFDVFGSYDLASVSASVDGSPAPSPTVEGTLYTWSVPTSQLTPGPNLLSIAAQDLQGASNVATVTYVEVTYPVSFAETGLPSGTAWSVTLNGATHNSTAPSISGFEEPNGSYAYTVRSLDPTFTALNGHGTLTVRGGAITVTIVFAEVESSVVFTETGLASGTSWSVTLGATQESTTSSQVPFTEPNGTYAFTVGVPRNYVVAPSAGNVTVSGATVTVALTFTAVPPHSYAVTFTEQNLPSGTAWSVTINGQTVSSTASTISVYEKNGQYSYTVRSSDPEWAPVSPSGSLSVKGGPVAVSVEFVEEVYTVTFEETGLPSGSSWAVAVGSVAEYSTTSSVAFAEPNGTYAFSVFGPDGYAASPASGSLTVSGTSMVVSIAFTADPSASGSAPSTAFGGGNVGLPASAPGRD